MKYLLMTSIVAALLVCPGCNRRDPADEPTYSNEDQQAPPSPTVAGDNPTVLADQVLLARLATKPASAPAPAAGPSAGSFMGVGGGTVPEAPASQPPTLATEPATPEAAPATEPAKPEGAGAGEPSSPPAPENPG